MWPNEKNNEAVGLLFLLKGLCPINNGINDNKYNNINMR